MSNQSFERQVAAALARIPELWTYHPPEPEGRKADVPGDFVFGHAGGWGVLEVKATLLPTLPAAKWPMHQRRHARQVERADGRYVLLVRYPVGIRLFYFADLTRTEMVHGLRHDLAWGHTLTGLDVLDRYLLS
jgi:hypothetical protein